MRFSFVLEMLHNADKLCNFTCKQSTGCLQAGVAFDFHSYAVVEF